MSPSDWRRHYHHHRRHHRDGPWSWHEGQPRTFYLRWRLQRRILLTLIVTIGITAAIGAFLLRAFGFAIHKPETTHALEATFVAFVILWAFSHKMAKRIAAPMAEFERCARELGAGNMSVRIKTSDSTMNVGEMPLLAHTINEMAERIEKQLQDQRALLATVSHEIRTPLARMRLLVEFAREGATEKAAAQLDELDKEVVGVDGLVSELLAASRIDFGALRRTELVPRAVAGQALERVGNGKSGVVLDDQTDDATFMGDATLLARAVGNLLENAKRHGGGAVRLRILERGPRIAFEVDDEGPGFSSGEEQQVFQPFFRGKNGGAKDSVGLGLSLVKRIAEAHGGRAYAQNRDGGGARVGIELSRV